MFNVSTSVGVMESVFASSVVDRGFELRSSRTKDTCICFAFYSKHAAFVRNSRLVSSESELCV